MSTPKTTQDPDTSHPGFFSRLKDDIEDRFHSVESEFTGGKKVNAVTDFLLIPTKVVYDEIDKPVLASVASGIGGFVESHFIELSIAGVIILVTTIGGFKVYKKVDSIIPF